MRASVAGGRNRKAPQGKPEGTLVVEIGRNRSHDPAMRNTDAPPAGLAQAIESSIRSITKLRGKSSSGSPASAETTAG